jgi:hypothetical protein
MVQGQQQQQTNSNTTNYLSNELLATTDPSRVQSEKVKSIYTLHFLKRLTLGNSRCTFSCSDIKNKFWYK